jgi:ketosteroid isomerase-like protein
MSNADIVRSMLCGEAGHPDVFWEIFHPDVVWDMSEFPEIETVYRGREAVRAFFFGWRYGWEYWRFDPEDVIEAGGEVVTLSGEDPERAGLWTLEDGKVVRFRWYQTSAAALGAARRAPGQD